MKKIDLAEGMSLIDDKYILEADIIVTKKHIFAKQSTREQAGTVEQQSTEEQAGTVEQQSTKPLKKYHFRHRVEKWSMGVAAAVFISILLPNMGAQTAYAMYQIPVLGTYFRTVTFRVYTYEDENKQADVELPQVTISQTMDGAVATGTLENSSQAEPVSDGVSTADAADRTEIIQNCEKAVGEINADVEQTVNALIEDFKAELSENEEGYYGLDVSYEVIMDNASYYTLKLCTLQVQGSGYEYHKYYTIDKKTGELLTLENMYGADSNYITVISDYIKETMRKQMAEDETLSYWIDMEFPEEDFKQISPKQNFYLNEKEELVISFGEGEVAPMYMGNVVFVIPTEVTESIQK